jgi:hypothetical protein
MEELIAELGAAFLCADLHITAAPRADHAQYLASWLAVLKADKVHRPQLNRAFKIRWKRPPAHRHPVYFAGVEPCGC